MMPYKYHTASRKILGDLITPVSAYLKVRDAYPQSALMESSDYHDANNSHSFIGINPMASLHQPTSLISLLIHSISQVRKATTADYTVTPLLTLSGTSKI